MLAKSEAGGKKRGLSVEEIATVGLRLPRNDKEECGSGVGLSLPSGHAGARPSQAGGTPAPPGVGAGPRPAPTERKEKPLPSCNDREGGDLCVEGGLQGLVPQLPDYSRKHRADEEWGALGLLASTHPLEYYAGALREHRVILSSELEAYVGQDVVLAGWLIAERRVGLKDRGAMKFLTLEDGGGVYEAVMFPEAYQSFGHLLQTHGPYFVGGEVQDEDGYCALILSWLEVVRERGRRPTYKETSWSLLWV